MQLDIFTSKQVQALAKLAATAAAVAYIEYDYDMAIEGHDMAAKLWSSLGCSSMAATHRAKCISVRREKAESEAEAAAEQRQRLLALEEVA